MADQVISLKIPEAKVDWALSGFLAMYPNNQTIPDPEWIDPKDGSKVPQIPKYTTKQWIAEKIRQIIVRVIFRGNQQLANKAAVIPIDNDVITIV